MTSPLKNPYRILGVTRKASHDEIKSAFRRLTRELHPDRNPDPKVTRKYRTIVEAWTLLRDPDDRARFDKGVPSIPKEFWATKEGKALGRKATSCPAWVWVPGMRADGIRVLAVRKDGLPFHTTTRNPIPDLQDPGTRGCLLDLVRVAWEEERLGLAWDEGWYITTPYGPLLGAVRFASEEEALVAALSEAPAF